MVRRPLPWSFEKTVRVQLIKRVLFCRTKKLQKDCSGWEKKLFSVCNHLSFKCSSSCLIQGSLKKETCGRLSKEKEVLYLLQLNKPYDDIKADDYVPCWDSHRRSLIDVQTDWWCDIHQRVDCSGETTTMLFESKWINSLERESFLQIG